MLKDKSSITPLKDFESLENEAPSYYKLIKEGTKPMEFSKSIIFMCIFKYFNEKYNDDSSLNYTINYYKLFYEMLNSKSINNDDEKIIYIVSNYF